MSAAKVQRVREKILHRGWQLTELFNESQDCYVTRISGLVADVGGEARLWNLQKALPASEVNQSALPKYEVLVRHYDKMIAEAEQYLTKAAAQVEAGEYLHDDRPQQTSENEGGPAGDDQGSQHTGSGILDALGNPIS